MAKRKTSIGVGALAFGTGLLAGMLGFMVWQRRQDHPTVQPQQEEPQVVYVRAPAPEQPRVLQLRMPQKADIARIMKSALEWTEHSFTDEHDQLIARWLWPVGWPGVIYPGPPQLDDEPSVARAHVIISSAIGVARAKWAGDRAKQAEAKPEQAQPATDERGDVTPTKLDLGLKLEYANAPIPAATERPSPDTIELESTPALSNPDTIELDPPSADTIESLTASIPLPGHFFRIPPHFADVSLGNFATLAVCCAAYEAGLDKGWPPDKAEARAQRFATLDSVRATYKSLLAQSKWNADRLYPLREGTLLWLPPIDTSAMRDRSRQPRFGLDPQPWPDGSSRIEPPRSSTDSSQPIAMAA